MAPHATLAELGLEYELALVERDEQGRPSAAYLALNPWGRIPMLEHDDLVLTEAAAICLYLADTFPEAGWRRRSGRASARSSTAGCSGSRTPSR